MTARSTTRTAKRLTVILAAVLLALTAAAPGVLAAIDCAAAVDPWCYGTDGDDTMLGTTGDDAGLYGYGGADTLYGYAGVDYLFGDAEGNPALDGADKLYGGGGADYLEGDGGADLLAGGPGNDEIEALEYEQYGHPAGKDTVRGGRGDDEILAGDLHKDVIDCGPGVDTVEFDKGLDVLIDCETKVPA
jgi:Ca2+-binding RTX toxin-like protein